MARASSVWVVEDNFGPLAAFTVKRELLAWLSRFPVTIGWKVIRLVDNSPGYAPVDASYLLNER